MARIATPRRAGTPVASPGRAGAPPPPEGAMSELEAMTAVLVEQQRRRDLERGITEHERLTLDADRHARYVSLAAQLRAGNDELEAQLNRRRTLRVVAS